MKTVTKLKRKLLESLDESASLKKWTTLLPRASGIVACLGITCTIGSSCGVLGDKKPAPKTLAQSDNACLDEMGPLMNEFMDGNVTEAKWVSTWNCVDDTIDLFKNFVQGSSATGYSAEDLRFLTQKFLFSKNKVTPEFIDGLLSVKASLLGGSTNSLSKDELDQYRALVRFLRDETASMIPALRARKVDPSPANLRRFANSVETFGVHLADYLKTSKNPKLKIEKAVLFMRELAANGLKTSPESMEAWTRFGMQLKQLLVRGDEDGIGGQDWSRILKMGFRGAGALVAYLDVEGDDPIFQSEMMDRFHGVLKDSMGLWGGMIPFSELEKILDRAPLSILPRLAEDFRGSIKDTLKPRTKVLADGTTKTYRPALARVLGSQVDTGIDAASIQRLADAYHAGMRTNAHLRSIFAGLKEDLYPADFSNLARAYATGKNAETVGDVNRLIAIANRYPGMHPANSPEINFDGQRKHSLNNLNRMSWYELAATLLLNSYGSTTDEFGKAAVIDDLTQVIDDYNPILIAIGMSHPLATGLDSKRFREANLFMPTGDGDDKMNLPETAVYLSYLFSAGRLKSRMVETTIKGPNPCPMIGWNVPLKQEAYDIRCFRSRWLENFALLHTSMPRLEDDFQAMTAPERDEFYVTLEAASKRSGYNEQPITEYDITSFAGLPHFSEAVMYKFDRNGDSTLDRDETVDIIFPIFKRELSLLSKIKIDFVNKAILLYLMQYGKQPAVKDLIAWATRFDFNKKFNARRVRVYQVFAALSPPSPVDPLSQTPPTGLGGSSGSLRYLANSSAKSGNAPACVESDFARSGRRFKLSRVDPEQLEGYEGGGPVIDPTSPYQEALEVLPQDL